ncbi:hypothetical protein N9948_02140 [bacterium]|nr:hypothetical protein [bacterium]
MATFKYVGSNTKDNGKIDLKVGNYSFDDCTPDTFEIVVPDGSQEEKYLEQAKDVFDGTYIYVKQ